MLPAFHQKVYQNFLEALKSLHEAVRQPKIDEVQPKFEAVRYLFETQVLGLTDEGLSPEIVSHWQSIQTELHRMFKLLATDWLFLRSSRQRSTSQQRLKLFSDRLEQMIKFCHILLERTGDRTEIQ